MDRFERNGVFFRGIVYSPLPSQQKFLSSAARFKGFSGPIGSGKSQALCQELIKLSYINAGRVGLIGSLTYPVLRDATLATLFDILNANAPWMSSSACDLAWFALDEPTYTPEAAWMVLEGRLRDPKPSGCADLGSGRPKFTTGSTESSYQSRCEATTRPNRAARDWCQQLFSNARGIRDRGDRAFSIEWQHGDPTPVAGVAQRYPRAMR